MDTKIALGMEAVAYVKDRLSNGHALAKFLLVGCNLNAGKVATFLPLAANLSRVREFQRGGILPQPLKSEWVNAIDLSGQELLMKPVPKADEGLVSVIRDFLRSSEEHLCIIENSIARPSDPYLKKLRSRILTLGEEVYHLLGSQDADEKTIKNTVNEARSYLEIGAMTSTPIAEALFAKKELSSDELKILALNTEKILIGAYDGEGYLIWSKPEAD